MIKKIYNRLFKISKKNNSLSDATHIINNIISNKINKRDTGVYGTFAYVCIMKRSQYFSAIVSKTSNTLMQRLLDAPNPLLQYSFTEIKKLVSESLDVYGNAYIYAPSENRKFPEYLYFIPTSAMRVNVEKGLIKSYTINSVTEVEPSQVIHFKNASPENLHTAWLEGVPKELRTVDNHIRLDTSLQDYIADYYENHAIPPLAIESDDIMSDAEYEIFKARFQEQIPESTISLLLENGLKIKALDTGLATMVKEVTKNVQQDIQMRIANAFSVPLSLITGLYQYQTAEAIRAEFMQTTIEPRHDYFDDVMRSHFRQYDKSFDITYDAYVSPEMGMETQAQAELVAENSYKKKALTEKQKSMYWEKKNNELMKYEKNIEKVISDIFADVGKEIIQNFRKTNTKNLTINDFEIEKLFDLEKYIAMMQEELTPEMIALVKSVITESLYEIDEEYIETEWGNEIEEIAIIQAKLASESIETLDKEVKNDILRIVNSNSDADYETLLDKIIESTSNKFDKTYTKSKARMVARTTTTATSGKSQAMTWKKRGRKYIWLSERDERVRPTHQKMDGKLVKESGNFEYENVSGEIINVEHPASEGMSADEAVNCRCVMFVVKDDYLETN